ncbi:tetratricopeptide repeat protein [Phenylobacterium sp.]|jgi:tetratricopeptide (TPR) repeat protein|uniref:tetratricopeptide repeat protein n=1 Tax=Phenylobacterium sp. TaxID=1871053 RepID=UPI0037C5DB25
MMFKIPLAAAALLALAATSAQASVTVIGGGMAQACSKAALGGETEAKFEAICTMALDSELLSLRDRAGTYVNRGVLKLRRKEFSSAQFDFNRAIETKPDLGEAYVNRGAASVGSRRFADGLTDLNKALDLGVEEPEKAYYNRALAYEGLDNVKAAYLDYQKAIELKPEWEQPKKELARFTVGRR